MTERYKPHTLEDETPHQRPIQYRAQIDTSVESSPKIESTQAVVDSINEPLLTEIFSEYYGKAGFTIDSLQPVPLDQLVIVDYPEEYWLGRFISTTQRIEINAGLLRNFSDLDKEKSILNTVVHEQIHAISAIYLKKTSGTDVDTRHSVGFERYSKFSNDEYSTTKITNTAVNEGLTQILTDDIVSEYVKRAGISKIYPDREKVKERGISGEAYSENQLRIRLVILFYSFFTEQDEEVVKKSLIRAYFRNTDMFPSEMNQVPENAEPLIRNFNVESSVNDLSIDINTILDQLTNYLPKEKRREFIKKSTILLHKHIEAVESTLK